MDSINAKYISQKISKTRWRPVSAASLQQPEVFATGSWDNEASSDECHHISHTHTDVSVLIGVRCVCSE